MSKLKIKNLDTNEFEELPLIQGEKGDKGDKGDAGEWGDLTGTLSNQKDLQIALDKKVNTSDLINLIYPVGSIYTSVNSTSPATLFGGTWEQIKDRFLLSAGDTYTAGSTGGEATHTLTIEEMPSHSHKLVSNTPQGSSDTISILSTFQGSDETVSFRQSNYVGGSKAHNNMPPYLVVYVWKRTA